MRPGLFLALLLLLCAPARAERAVGLEAQGVDPAAALHNPLGLDVRDALGRPVTRVEIERQVKASQVEAAAETSVFSRLPEARAVARLLAYFQPLWTWFGLPRPLPLSRAAWALGPSGRAAVKVSAVLVALVALTLCTGASGLRLALSRLGRHAAAPVVLRC